MRHNLITSAILALLGSVVLFLGRRYIRDHIVTLLQPKEERIQNNEEDNLIQTKTKLNKKVKVNYPLFVKKSRSNMFKRAIREDFKRETAPVAKRNERVLNDSIVGDY
jgi:hypothetical protein